MQAYPMPSQTIVWVTLWELSKDYELKKEAVLLNHLSKTVLVTFRTERQTKLVLDFLFRKAPRVSCPCISSTVIGPTPACVVNVSTSLAPCRHCCVILSSLDNVFAKACNCRLHFPVLILLILLDLGAVSLLTYQHLTVMQTIRCQL